MERKVRIDIEMDVFDIYQIEDISKNFDNENSTRENLKPSISNIKNCIFNLNNFKSIYDEMKCFETQTNFIKIFSFIEIYIKKYLINSNNSGIPANIRSLSFHNFIKFIKLFELPSPMASNSGGEKNEVEPTVIHIPEYLNLKNIFIVLAIINCKILDENNENNLIMKAEPLLINDSRISKEDFMKIDFWFEKDATSISKLGNLF
jgi:hypothetical protein